MRMRLGVWCNLLCVFVLTCASYRYRYHRVSLCQSSLCQSISPNNMGGNTHAGQLMGTKVINSGVRNVSNKTVVREFQAVVMQLHLHFFNSPEDYRARAFALHCHAPNKPPIEASILQTYAVYIADHLVQPCRAGMDRLVYVLEGYSDGKHLPNGAAQRRTASRLNDYKRCNENAVGADWTKCVVLSDCAARAIMAEVAKRKTDCPVSFLLPPGEADSVLAEMAKDENNIVCVDSNDGDVGTLFFNPEDIASLHYSCKWSVPQAGQSGKVALYEQNNIWKE